MGEAFIAHEPRALGPELHHLGGDGAIVGLAAFLAPRCPGAKGFLAQIAPGRELQERFDARARQGDGVFARMAALDRDARGALRKEIRQAVEIALGEQHQPVFFVRQHILAELGAERRQPLADRGEAVLGFGREACASAGEIEMITLEHTRLFGRKPERVLARLQGVDAPEQGIVQIDVAAMAREDRGDLAFDRLDLVIARGAGEIEEDARHFVARLPAALQRLDGVGEGRRLRIGDDGVDLRPRPGDGGVERGPEMRGFDALERRRLERPGPGFEKRVSIDVRDGHEDVSDGAAQRLRDARAGLSQYLTIPATMQNASSEPPAARRPRKLFSPRRLRDRYDLSRPFRFELVKTKNCDPRGRAEEQGARLREVTTNREESDEECSVRGRARFPGLPLGLGSDGPIGRHQQGGRRLYVRGRRQRGARPPRRTASRSPSPSSPTPPATAFSIPSMWARKSRPTRSGSI